MFVGNSIGDVVHGVYPEFGSRFNDRHKSISNPGACFGPGVQRDIPFTDYSPCPQFHGIIVQGQGRIVQNG